MICKFKLYMDLSSEIRGEIRDGKLGTEVGMQLPALSRVSRYEYLSIMSPAVEPTVRLHLFELRCNPVQWIDLEQECSCCQTTQF